MVRGARYAYVALAWAFVAGVVLQVFFIGMALFVASENLELHVTFGWILPGRRPPRLLAGDCRGARGDEPCRNDHGRAVDRRGVIIAPLEERDPSDCCGPAADPRVARRFDRSWSDWDDEKGFPPMVDVSALLLDHLRDAPLVRPTVLEIGCGTGGVSVALLEMGARQVKGVDLSPASIDLARRRAEAAGFGEHATFEVGQGAAVRDELHDWVVVDRVLCCDGHLDRMLDAVVGAARTRVALSVPESRGWRGLLNRPMWAAENVWDRLTGGCLGHVHDLRHIERRLATAGFRPVATGRAGLWFMGVYDRG